VRIFINAIGSSVGGGVTYLKGLIHGLAKVDADNEYVVGVRADRGGFYDVAASNFRFVVYDVARRGMPVRFLWEQVFQPREMKRLGVDLLFMPHSYGSARPGVPQVVCLQVPYPVQEYATSAYHKLRWAMRNTMLRMSVARTTTFITVSDDLRQVVHRMFGIPLDRMVPIHHGADLHFAPGDPATARARVEAALGLRGRYLLTVSDLYVHKNYMNLVRAFDAGRERLGERKLVVAGDLTDKKEWARIEAFLRERKLKLSVLFPGRIGWDNLKDLYVGADGFVFPSKHETFGLPPLEAMASGIPVAVSRASCMPEICGEAARYFDPDDPRDMADAMVALATDETLRADLIGKGSARVREFTWEKCARKHREVFERAVK
jgi:glycosyltransferase involved in cell wall biosynthesis